MKISALFLALYLLSPVVSADIFKCSDGKGHDKYQNFPCAIDSIGSKATAAPPKEDPVKPASQATATADTVTPNYAQPEAGMKMNDVRAGWGTPKATNVLKGVETWYYDGPGGMTRGVRFDRTGTVLSVSESQEPPATEPE